MANRVKYPLTEEAKEAAKRLVVAWDRKEIPQVFICRIASWTKARLESPHRPEMTFEIGALMELEAYQLMYINTIEGSAGGELRRWEIQLPQELRNAVQNDFEVSDFFLTTSAVGTIINLGEGASVSGIQSIAINYGTAVQNVEQLADSLVETLGETFIQANAEIKAAIDELRQANETSQTSRVGGVIEALGRYMTHAGSAASVVAGIQMLVQFLH